MKNTFSILAFIAFTFLACSSSPKIDASSKESYDASIAKIEKTLNAEQKQTFNEALNEVMSTNIDLKDLGDLISGKFSNDIRKKVDGKTAKEVIVMAKEQKEKRIKEGRATAKQQIDELYKQKAELEAQLVELNKFEVSNAQLSSVYDNFFKRDDYYVTITVKNGTSQAISRAYFEGIMKSPNRDVPWSIEKFDYKINGGINPGESTTWKIKQSIINDWDKSLYPKDAVLTVKAVKLKGGAGVKELYNANIAFDEYDQKKLEKLLKDYPEFKR